MKTLTRSLLALTTALSFYTTANDALPPDTYILSTTLDYIHYYDKQGQLLASMQHRLPHSTESLRDLVNTPNGIAVYSGTFDASLAMIHPTHIAHLQHEGLSSVNNGTAGGIAVLGRYAYLTDMATANAASKGIVRFDLESETSQAYFTEHDYMDITLGNNGLLYALRNVYGELDIIEPVTMKRLKQHNLGHTSSSRAVTATKSGEIFMVSWDGYLHHYSQEGELFSRQSLDNAGFADIDINAQGELLVTARDGMMYLFDEAGTQQNTIFQGYTYQAFAAFAALQRNFPAVLKKNALPNAIEQQQPLTLDLTGSYDPEGAPVIAAVDTTAGFNVEPTEDPLRWTLTATQPGEQQITITLNDGMQSTTNTVTVSVAGMDCETDPNAKQFPVWQPNTLYTHETVSYDGLVWQAKWWNQNSAPSFSGPWQLISEIALPWHANRQYLKGNIVTYQGQQYRANWWTSNARPVDHPAWMPLGPVSGC
ncbi:hypothetical protein L4C36_16045 [Photobacterium japonica]|uniref:carbohydrate-binding protein n=1 Tax=Photobacterium japonica TaxID=2910235 RepID=UPI003D13F0A4